MIVPILANAPIPTTMKRLVFEMGRLSRRYTDRLPPLPSDFVQKMLWEGKRTMKLEELLAELKAHKEKAKPK